MGSPKSKWWSKKSKTVNVDSTDVENWTVPAGFLLFCYQYKLYIFNIQNNISLIRWPLTISRGTFKIITHSMMMVSLGENCQNHDCPFHLSINSCCEWHTFDSKPLWNLLTIQYGYWQHLKLLTSNFRAMT